MNKRLGNIAYITKLAGFEHTNYIQGNCTHEKNQKDDLPLFIGKTVRNGKIDINFDWYISKTISDSLIRSKLTKKCLVMPYVGTVGDLAIYYGTFPAHLGSNIAKIELNENCGYSEEFIYYFIKTSYGQNVLLRDIQGAVQKNITMEAIRNVELPSISLEKQNKIVNILKLYDDKINLNDKINIELESMARTIYDYWFLQFEFPNDEGKSYKSCSGKMVWNEELKREIPEGWKCLKVKDCIKHINTGLNPRNNFVLGNGNIKYVTVKNLTTNGTIDFSGCDLIDEKARKIVHNRSNVSKNDLLFASIAPLGRCTIVYENPEDWDINESVFCIRPNLDILSSEYLYLYFMSSYFIKKAEHSSTGSVFNGIRISVLENMNILIPDYKTMTCFTEYVSKCLYFKNYNYNENKELISLRDFLLPMLMNGQVGFKD